MRFTRAYRRKVRRGITTVPRATAGDTAFEVRGAGAQACEGASAACIRPAAVAATAACGFGAASNVVRGARAGVGNVSAATGSALCGGDAGARGAGCACARAVDG